MPATRPPEGIMMTGWSSHFRLVVCAVVALPACGVAGPSHTGAVEPKVATAGQSASDQAGSAELEEMLFVQAPEHGIPKDGIVLGWLPAPLQKLCMGKTASRCASIDYCIRTTNRDVPMCRNLGIHLSRISPYPEGTRPRRMLSLTLSRIRAMNGNGFDLLQNFYNGASRESMERLSMSARIKARIQFIRKPDDDDFNLIQVVAAPPF